MNKRTQTWLKNLLKKQEKQHEITKLDHQENQEKFYKNAMETDNYDTLIECIFQMRADQIKFKEYAKNYETTMLIIKDLLKDK